VADSFFLLCLAQARYWKERPRNGYSRNTPKHLNIRSWMTLSHRENTLAIPAQDYAMFALMTGGRWQR
jgi:hypothetical protein